MSTVPTLIVRAAAAVAFVAVATKASAQFEQCGAAPSTICRAAARGSFAYTDNRLDDTKDRLSFKWQMGESTSFDEFADPTTTADYRLCVYAGGGAFISQAIIPAGGACASGPCWQEKSGRAFHYNDPTGARGGVTLIRLVASDRDRAGVKVKGKGGALYDPQLPFATPVVVELHNASTGVCWAVGFSALDIQTNSALKGKFRARRK